MSITLAAAASEPDAGWSRLVALVAAGLLFWLGTLAHQRYKSLHDSPSPIGKERALSGAKPQVKAVGGTSVGTGPGRGPARAGQLDVWVGEQVGRRNTMSIVREAQRRFGASKRTVLRAVKRARGEDGVS